MEEEFRKNNTRLLEENEKILKEINIEKEKLLNEEKRAGSEIQELKNRINELSIKNISFEKELENLKKSNGNWE